MRKPEPDWPALYCFSLVCFPLATIVVACGHFIRLRKSAPERKRTRELKKAVRKIRRRRQKRPPQEIKPVLWPQYHFRSRVCGLMIPNEEFSKQEQSLFLNGLPLEIRQQIYEVVLGGHTFHLAHGFKRLLHTRCLQIEDPWNSQQHECWQDRPDYWGPQPGGHLEMANTRFRASNEQTAALLKTCRMINLEATKYLYASNTFSIRHPLTLVDLKSSIPSSSFSAIRSLHVSLPFDIYRYDPNPPTPDPPYDTRFWKHWWFMIAHLSELRTLRVELYQPSRGSVPFPPTLTWNWETAERAISALEPLNAVWQTEVFELKISYARFLMSHAELGWIANAAFRLVTDDE